ncbi:MAG: flavodoxin [Bacteroidetes bacterium GWF2_42_66]|nr:MAG: flavodoxin [Bacteroidetes bacterium GWA2_42_15]OFY01523.1 MAG: flavodoxin [Bacteroidetes bacterium GWE2_42_39]OFY43296.1 MAG: flavodoxin [Bacteroidetes bacterium GWF2_42_66]HBL77521.1 FprA family A-type flavoprotein [Prolixibacteraceae bacterium]HCR90684.1 FprA family A-type flavoprotein [Prolixibacteraceae bacterium]
MHHVKLADNIYYLGYNDRRTHLFENIWPIPHGVSYNSYLIDDEKIALVDTVERQFIDDYLDDIHSIIGDRKVDYLIINHMEPDHSGALKAIVAKYPDIILVGNKKTFGFVESFYMKPVNTHEVYDGHVLELGKTRVQFQAIPMVHWPETMVSFEETNQILFSGDAFGSYGTLDGGIFDDEINLDFYEIEVMRYFTNIVGKYCPHTQRAIKKLAGLDIKMIAATHGPIWRSDLNWVLSRYDKWSSYTFDNGVIIVYGSMYGNTQKMAEVIARQLSVRGIRDIRVYDASKTHSSYIINDIFKYKGFIVGSCAYNNSLFPNVETLLSTIEHMGIKDHYLGVFGNFSWNGGGVKNLMKFAETINWDLVYEPVEEKGALKKDKFEQCIALANAMADKLLG